MSVEWRLRDHSENMLECSCSHFLSTANFWFVKPLEPLDQRTAFQFPPWSSIILRQCTNPAAGASLESSTKYSFLFLELAPQPSFILWMKYMCPTPRIGFSVYLSIRFLHPSNVYTHQVWACALYFHFLSFRISAFSPTYLPTYLPTSYLPTYLPRTDDPLGVCPPGRPPNHTVAAPDGRSDLCYVLPRKIL